MPSANLYHPVVFFLITISISLFLGPMAVYLSNNGKEKFLMPLLLFGLCVPCITAIVMIYASRSEILINDFWQRLFNFNINPFYLTVILLLMPCVVLLATVISLMFGYSTDQFTITSEFSVIKRWGLLGIMIPIVLAPIIEEIGWRGYGVDSLRAFFNLFTTSILFGFLWAVWHLPGFFIKDYYHNKLWHLGIAYVINFFASVFVIAILMNWIYYRTGRSIPGVILFHSVINLSSMLLKTDPFTKCIVTVLLGLATIIVIICDRNFFFSPAG